MAKQNQPSNSGTYSSSSSSGGRNKAEEIGQTLNFKESVIDGSVQGQDDFFYINRQNPNAIPWPVADAAELKDEISSGNNGKAVIKLIEWLIQKVKEYLSNDNGYSFGQNFNITYHNHDITVPIPLSPFITNLAISESHNAPYTTARISLKIPFEHIQVMFRNGGGRIDPGGFICIRQKQAPTADDIIDNKRAQQQHFLSHLMCVSNINYIVQTEQSSGRVMTDLVLDCSSYLSPLLSGQYVVSEATNVDTSLQNPQLEVLASEINARLDALGVPADSPRREFLKLTVPKGRRAERRGDIIGEFFYDTDLYNKFLSLILEGSITRKHSGRDMKDLLTFLGYPKLPSSLTGEFDLQKWISAIEKDLDKGAVFYVRLLRTIGISEEKIQQIGEDLLNVFDQITRNDANPNQAKSFVDRPEKFITTGAASSNVSIGPFEFNTTTAGPGDTTIAAENLTKELGLRNTLNNVGQFVEGIEQRIGDVVRIITSVEDLPKGIDTNNLKQFPWYYSLGEKALVNENINKIGNLYSKGQTIWGACVATFQPDPKTHELFPVVIPLIDDAWFKVANDFERKLGGILCIIYRKKPMHPQIDLNRESLNKEYRGYRKIFGQAIDEPYYQDVSYKLDSEQLGLNQDSRISLINTVVAEYLSGEGAKEYYANSDVLPMIPYRDVISMAFNHTNSDRVNGVQCMHPYSQTQPELSDLTKPYINVADASRYGLRFYQTNYPFLDLAPLEQGALNQGNTTAERLYMTLGDGSKYSVGIIELYLETTYSIKQGCWFAIDYSEQPKNVSKYIPRFERENFFIAYCDSIEYSFVVSQDTGNIICKSSIGYSRGSWGGIIPELPSYQTYLESKEEKISKIVAPSERRIVSGMKGAVAKTKPGEVQQPVKAIEAVKPEIRFASDEWGSYGDAAAVARRNEAFSVAWSGLTPAQQAIIIKNQTATGEADGTFFDLDGDGFYEWVQVELNYLHIPKDKRPKVDGYIFETYQEILGPGFVSPYPSGYTAKPATKATATTPAVGSGTN